jgi:hypothetical protein
MYLQLPDKLAAYRQFSAQYRPRQRHGGYKQGWVPGPAVPRAQQRLGVNVPTDPELVAVVEAWPKLGPERRAYILSLIKSAR